MPCVGNGTLLWLKKKEKKLHMLVRKTLFWIIYIFLVYAYIVGCKVGFGLLVYHTYVWFFSSSQSYIFFWNLKMAQFSINENMINENTCEVFMNDVMEEEYEINPNLQIESNQNPKNEKKH